MMQHKHLCLVAVLAVTISPWAIGAEDPGDKITVNYDQQSLTSTITIKSSSDRVAWADILRGIARAKGFDDSALEGILPGGTFNVTSVASLLQVATYNALLSPNIRFRVEPRTENSDAHLLITLNREALLASERRMKLWLRQKILSAMGTKDSDQKFGLLLDKRWKRAKADRNLVILVHGLNSDSHEADPLLAQPRRAGFPCGCFQYPNDQPIDKSAKLLARELAEIAKEYPNRNVTLLAFSMGGLVSRAVIENPRLDPGNVNQLIMISPPNHGSQLAHFGYGLDVWEFVVRSSKRKEARRLYRAIEDGFAEAVVDLRPDSPFLTRLNARQRNPRAEYSIILGNQAPLTENELTTMRDKLAGAGRRNRWVQFFGTRVDGWLADLDEVVDQRGDGAVAVKRGRLAGVDDVVELKFSHHHVLTSRPVDGVKQIHDEVLKRLNNRNAQ